MTSSLFFFLVSFLKSSNRSGSHSVPLPHTLAGHFAVSSFSHCPPGRCRESRCSEESAPEACAEHPVTRHVPLSPSFPTPTRPTAPSLCITQSRLILHSSLRARGGRTVWQCRAPAPLLLNHQSAVSVGRSVWADTWLLLLTYSMRRGASSSCHQPLMRDSCRIRQKTPVCVCRCPLNADVTNISSYCCECCGGCTLRVELYHAPLRGFQ